MGDVIDLVQWKFLKGLKEVRKKLTWKDKTKYNEVNKIIKLIETGQAKVRMVDGKLKLFENNPVPMKPVKGEVPNLEMALTGSN